MAKARLFNSKQSLCKLPRELLSIVLENLKIEAVYYFAQSCQFIRVAVHNHLYRERGHHLLQWAASNGKTARVREVLALQKVLAQEKKFNINSKISGRTALALAIENYTTNSTIRKSGRMEKIDFAGTTELLLDHPDIDLKDETNGIAMLQTAIENGIRFVVERHLQRYPDAIDTVFRDGDTPLTTAICRGRTDILQLLIDRGADVNKRNGSGRTALAQAIERCNLNCVEFLSKQRKTVWTDEANGIPVFERAIEKGILLAVDMGLQCHKDSQAYVNTPFDNGQTPLVNAALWGREEILDLLVCRGANVNQVCGHVTHFGINMGTGWTALTMAAKKGHEKIVQRLLRCPDIKTHLISVDAVGSGDAVFRAAVEDRPNCVLALLRSDKVSYSAEQIDQLLSKVKSVELRPGANFSIIYELLGACQGTNSPESRRTRLKGQSRTNMSARRIQTLLERGSSFLEV